MLISPTGTYWHGRKLQAFHEMRGDKMPGPRAFGGAGRGEVGGERRGEESALRQPMRSASMPALQQCSAKQ